MSSHVHHFVETLNSIGYKSAKQLNPSAFEWMFDTGAAAFLVWFCNSVRESNVLHPDEIKGLSKLEKAGVGLFEVDQVERILISSNHLNDDLDLPSKEMLRREIYKLKENKRILQKRKEALRQHKRLLSGQLASVKNSLFRAENSQRGGQQSYLQSERKAQVANNSTNASNGRLKESVKSINSLYERPGYADLETEEDAVFLTQVNLKHLQKQEDGFIQEVTDYCKKQFFEGIANMAGYNEECLYSMMEIDDHKMVKLREENLQSYLVYSQEFTRLKQVYPEIESFRVMSCVELTCQKSIHDEAVAIRKEVQALQWRQYKSSLRSQLEMNQSSIQVTMLQLLHQTEEVMPKLIKQSTQLHVLPIISGDYNLKLARQDYFSAKQDQVINYLVLQRSRNEFLSMAYDVESRNHRYVYRLLQALHAQLSTQEQSHQERMAMMQETRLDPVRHQRATIDYRDTCLLRLHSVLPHRPEDDKNLFQKLSSLVEGADKLSLKLSSSQSSSMDLCKEQVSRLKLLIKECDRVMHRQSTRTSGPPQLTPYPIKKSHRQLDKLLNQLGTILKDVIVGVDQKKKILKCFPGKRAERELYEFFLLSPDRLLILFEKLGAQLEAKRTK